MLARLTFSISLLMVFVTNASIKANDFIGTDYYRAYINSDGSLDITDKDTGAPILTDSPQFFFDYGATNSVPITVPNGGFEIDDNNDNIPDWWYVNRPIIRLSTQQASGGSKSLKFDATSTDDQNQSRYALSPVFPVAENSKYTISIDSYMNSFTSGTIRVYVYYYENSDGSGQYVASYNWGVVPIVLGSWVTTSFDWTPTPLPFYAKSFRIMISMYGGSTVATFYIDNVSITKKNIVYVSHGSNIGHTSTVNGDTTTITAIDDTNPYATVNHQYQLNTHSPYIKYNVTLQYKQDVLVSEERFNFVVPSQDAQAMTRDLQLTHFNPFQTYWSDLYTPKVVSFTNGLSFLGSDTMESMRLRASGYNSNISFYSDYGWNHPHISYDRDNSGRIAYANETRRSAGDTYSASVTFAIDTNETLNCLVKTRQPYGYDAALTLTNHPDYETLPRIKAVAYGTEDENDPDYGTKGIVARGLGWTKGVFVSGTASPYASLEDASFKALTDKMYQDGVEIVGHTITPETDNRPVVAAGLAILSQYNAKNWIDHRANNTNWEDIASQGAIDGNEFYILDLLDEYNYHYAWSYKDLLNDNTTLNLLKAQTTADIRPFLFYNNRIDDNPYDKNKMYMWSTELTLKIPETFYTSDKVNSLIDQRGMHIGHEYLGYVTCEGHAWYIDQNDNNTIKISPMFDSELEYIAEKRSDGLLWSPTVSRLGDYLVPLKDVSITYNADAGVTVTNNSSVDITGITLLAEANIQLVKCNNYDLVSFGDSYGEKELVLPTIAPGSSIVLNITYGTKDNSIPTIVSNDSGKSKVNEITGYWNSTYQILTMTAEAHDGNYSFTVTIPSLPSRTLIVKDITTNTVIGEYITSNTGVISFTAHLGSLHTFKIFYKYFAVVDDFSFYGSTGDLQNVWHPYLADIRLNMDPNFAYGGDRSMKFEYQGDSHVGANTVDEPCLPSLIGRDWTVGNSKMLTLTFCGLSPNSVLPMYVTLMDESDNAGTVFYGDGGEDQNDLGVDGWHEWDINLGDFNKAGVDLTRVKDINVGFGTGNGGGTLYFANIKLSPPKCIFSKRSADFARVDDAPAGGICGDCVIDYQELAVMGSGWLMTPPPDTNADLNSDGTVDFMDFTILANMWLKNQLWPQ